MRREMAFLVLVICAPMVMGCGTLFASGPDLVPIYSDPSGAAVRLDGMEVGKTPCIVAVPRSSEGVFTFELAGFETAKVDRDKVLNGVALLNLLGGYVTIPVFFFIDIVTGDIGKYSTEEIRVTLTPVVGARPPPGCLRLGRWR